jgi:hypothetical protein
VRPVAWPNAHPVLDQGDQPACTAFGTLGLLNTDDEVHNNPGYRDADAFAFFKTIPGAGPDGAMVRDALKAAKAQGLIRAYALLVSEAEVDEWLSNHGPVLVGSAWDEQMTKPVGGLVLVGHSFGRDGHCWFVHGQDTYYRLATNSWGTSWGESGLFKMRRCDFGRLHAAGGEAWAVAQDVPKVQPRASWWARLMRLFGGKP